MSIQIKSLSRPKRAITGQAQAEPGIPTSPYGLRSGIPPGDDSLEPGKKHSQGPEKLTVHPDVHP
jgi:hypothetical protein